MSNTLENKVAIVTGSRRHQNLGAVAGEDPGDGLADAPSRTGDDGAFVRRGINSIQLMWEKNRWWLLSIIWDDESPENPIPAAHMP